MGNINLQRVPFHEAEITSFQDDDGTVWVSLVRACESLDIEYNNQYKKITSSDLYRTQKFTYEGGSMLMMDAKGLTRWLMSIQPGKVKEVSRDRLIRWQDESYEALRSYWFDGIALNPNATDEQKDASAEVYGAWFSARRSGINTRKDFVSMIATLRLSDKFPDAYKRSTRDLYNRLFNNTVEDREEIVAKFISAKGQKTYVDPDGKRRAYNYRDTLSARQVGHLEDAERRIETAALALHEAGLDPEEAYSRARDGVLRKMGNVTPF